MLLALAMSERIKLAAAWCNALATAIITVGIFAPLVYLGTTSEVIATERYELFYGVMGICGGTGLILHLLGHIILSRLEFLAPTESRHDGN
jgi:hypothetical protein